MIFEAVGGDEIAKLKNVEPGRGKHLYLFTEAREWEVIARKTRIVGLYEEELVPQAALRSKEDKDQDKGTDVMRTFLLEKAVSGTCGTEFRLQN